MEKRGKTKIQKFKYLENEKSKHFSQFLKGYHLMKKKKLTQALNENVEGVDHRKLFIVVWLQNFCPKLPKIDPKNGNY